MHKLTAAAAVVCLGLSSAAHAQDYSSLGALLDKGGSRINAEALKVLLTGATVSGSTMNRRAQTEVTFVADGTIRGSLWGVGDQPPSQLSGKWQIDDKGNMCTEIASIYNTSKGCTSYYKVGDAVYVAESDERSAAVRPRKVAR